MKQFYTKTLFFICLIILPLIVINAFCLKRIKTATFKKALWVMNKRGGKYDYVAIGSSRADNIIDPNLINQKASLSGINIANSGSAFLENYLTLLEFLDKNQTQSVLLCADIFGVINPSRAYGNRPFHEYFFISYLDNDTICHEVSNQVSWFKMKMWEIMPLTGYMEYNNIYTLDKLMTGKFDNNKFDNNKGFDAPPEKSKTVFNVKNGYSYYGIDSASVSYLNKIIALCNKRKTKLILYSPPIYFSAYKKMLGADKGFKLINSIAEKHNITYLNFANSYLSLDSNLFNDNNHLNFSGSQLFSSIIGDSLKSKLIQQ